MSTSSDSMRAFVGRGPKDAPKVEQIPVPQLQRDTDVRIKVHAVATNPVDIKSLYLKQNAEPVPVGWDASGVIESVGKGVTKFKVGDEVYVCGDVTRGGNFSDLHVVDSRLVAHKPKSLSHAEAAAFPLVALTAMEALYENMRIEKGKSILVHPGGGGVGSIAIQLAKQAGLTVFATAGREETKAWAKKMGADHVLDYKGDLAAQLKAAGTEKVNYIFNTYSEKALPQLAPLIAFRGTIVGINGDGPITDDVMKTLFFQCATFSLEMIFARVTLDQGQEQHGQYLEQLAKDIDAGKIKPIHNPDNVLKGFESLEKAQENQQSGKQIGKQVIQLV